MSEENKVNIQKNLQIKLEQLIELQELANTYQQLIEANTIVLSDIVRTRQALKELLDTKDEILSGLINLGAGIYIEGEIRVRGKMLIDIGAGVVIPVSVEEAIEKLRKRENQVRESIENARQMIMKIQNTISKLQVEINKLRKIRE